MIRERTFFVKTRFISYSLTQLLNVMWNNVILLWRKFALCLSLCIISHVMSYDLQGE